MPSQLHVPHLVPIVRIRWNGRLPHDPLKEIVRILCFFYQVLRLARNKYAAPAFNQANPIMMANLHMSLVDLQRNGRLLVTLLNKSERNLVQGWDKLDNSPGLIQIPSETMLETAIQCLLNSIPHTTPLAQIRDDIITVFRNSILNHAPIYFRQHQRRPFLGLPAVIFISVRPPPRQPLFLVGATGMKAHLAPFKQFIEAYRDNRTDALQKIKGNGRLKCLTRNLVDDLDVNHGVPPGALMQELLGSEVVRLQLQATNNGRQGEAYDVISMLGVFVPKGPCAKCRAIHQFLPTLTGQWDLRCFPALNCAEDSWVLKAI